MKRVALLLLLFTSSASGLKILIDQIVPSPSHLLFSGALADALAKRGHVVDKVIRVFHPLIQGNGSRLARHVHRVLPRPERPIPFAQIGHMRDSFDKLRLEPWDANMLKTNMILCEDMLDNSELIEQLKAEEYDVGLTPSYTGCGTGLFHLLGIKSTHSYLPFASWDGLYEMMGIPVPNFTPGICLDNAKTTEPSFLQRAYSLWVRWTIRAQAEAAIDAESEIFQRKFPHFPALRDLYHKHAFFFQNTADVLGFQQPLSAKIKNIGGIATPPAKPLHEQFDRLLSAWPRGTVVVSFGSLLRTAQIPPPVQRAIVRSFAQFPSVLFLWKHDDPEGTLELVGNTTNVRLMKWLPQNDLLNDPRTKLFVTHTGLNSFLETSRAGVPVIGVPAVADQHYNAAAAAAKGMGVKIDPQGLNEETLTAALREVLDNPKYTQQAKEISRLLVENPQQPADLFVDLVEYAAAHPQLGELLSLPGREFPFLVYHSLDVLLVAIFLLTSALLAALFTLRSLLIVLRWPLPKEKLQ
ncbi:Glucuronosyltransferase [Aphelenchoides fujianensis]|nr:Glucuronosyltransferase [Aphelenchoides fujianensis]